MGHLMYDTVAEISEQKLKHSVVRIEEQVLLWFKERKYDLYVFSNSQIITANIEQLLEMGPAENGSVSSTTLRFQTIQSYLHTISSKFEEYEALHLFHSEGDLLLSSDPNRKLQFTQLPQSVIDQLQKEQYGSSSIYYTPDNPTPLILIATKINTDNVEGQPGIMAIEVQLKTLRQILQASLRSISWNTQMVCCLVNLDDNTPFLSTDQGIPPQSESALSKEIALQLKYQSGLQIFTSEFGKQMVGISHHLSEFPWGLIIAENYDQAFQKVQNSNTKSIYAVLVFTLFIGVMASLLARQIIRPIKALANGAKRVSEGELAFQLPEQSRDELGFTIKIFNEMVDKLGQSKKELEQLATTDALTSLANRKHILQLLTRQMEYYKRYGTSFSILMVDVDHFKQINDNYGHLAGDEVLKSISKILHNSLRNVDSAGRYGGEEFIVLLAESGKKDCWQVAERIRKQVSTYDYSTINEDIHITVSIGATQISTEDSTENDIIHRADTALYKAKNEGRDKTVYFERNFPRESN